MKRIGLTGGIGSGKSTVAALLVERGCELIDADAIVRELQVPGQAVFSAMVDAFGDGILADDGTLDRAAVAQMVFNDADQLKMLTDIVHPAVFVEVLARIEKLAETDALVIQDIPLLAESGRTDFSGVVVVDIDPEIAIGRLVEHRGFDRADAEARIANQASRDERLAVADKVIDNSGSLDDLVPQINAVFAWMQTLPDSLPPEPKTDESDVDESKVEKSGVDGSTVDEPKVEPPDSGSPD